MPENGDEAKSTSGDWLKASGGETLKLTTDDEVGAPHLRYDLPAGTEFEYIVYVPLNVALDKFRSLSNKGEDASPSEVPSYYMPVIGPVKSLPVIEVTKSPLLVDPLGPIWNPENFTRQFLNASTAPRNSVAEQMEVMNERLSSAGEALLSERSSFRPLDHLVYEARATKFQAVLRKNFYGDIRQLYVAKPEQRPRQELFIAERYRVASYLGDFGATSVVSTVTLLPGEKTTITLSQSVNDTEQRSITTNVLDSYNSQSAQEFEGQVSDQQSLGFNETNQAGGQETTLNATQMSASLSVSGGVNLGLVKIGESASGSIAHQTSDTNTTTHNHLRQDSAQTVRSALDRHVNQSSSARSYQASTGTQQQSTVATSESNVTVRTIENINRSRVLNFVIRQLSQEYYSVTYLHDAQFVYVGPNATDIAVATTASLNELLSLVLVDDEIDGQGNLKSSARREVLAQIVHSLSNVTSVKTASVSLIRHFKPPEIDAVVKESGLQAYLHTTDDGLPRFARNSRAYFEEAQQGPDNPLPMLGDKGGPITVDGIVVDVARRILKTNSLVADALLGRSTALDSYNVRLQDAAASKQELANKQVDAALAIVEGAPDGATKAAIFEQVFGLHNDKTSSPTNP